MRNLNGGGVSSEVSENREHLNDKPEVKDGEHDAGSLSGAEYEPLDELELHV